MTMKKHSLFRITSTGKEDHIGDFDNFYDAIEFATFNTEVRIFRLYDNKKYLTGLRIASDQVVWRLPRNGKEKRGRDRWVSNLLNKIYREVRNRL